MRLAIDGGPPVRARPWPSWPAVSRELWVEEVEPALREVFLSGEEGLPNRQARLFEAEWRAYTGVAHALATSHGTDALQALAWGVLEADGLGCPGEVIVPNYTFIASATAFLAIGCRVRLVDVRPETGNLDPAAAEAAIGPATVGLLAVHLGGQAADMDALREIAGARGLALMEDCCQAHGARHGERQVGGLADGAALSFQSSKNLCVGEGGLVTTDDEGVWRRAVSYHNIGRALEFERWEHPRLGWNHRLGEYQAALLRVRLRRLDAETARRDANGRRLTQLLADVPGFTPPLRQTWCTRHAYHLFMARYEPARFGNRSRADFLAALRAEGIPCSPGYGRLLSDQPALAAAAAAYPERLATADCPAAREILATSVWLPQNLLLAEPEEMADIATAIARIQQAWGE